MVHHGGDRAPAGVAQLVAAPDAGQVFLGDRVLRARGTKPVRREGQREGRWVLIDFVDIVVHVQHDEERSFYELERLWKDCPTIDLGVVGTEQGGR